MLPLRIAARFIRTSKGQSFLIVGGIAVGIAVQVFVGSIIVSLQASLLDTTIGSSPHVTLVNVNDKKPLRFDQRMRALVTADPRVSTAVPVRTVSGIFAKGTDSAPLNLIGGGLAPLDTIYRVSRRTVAGRASLGSGEIMLGTSLATKYRVNVGDPVLVSLPDGSRESLRLVGIFDLGAAAANDRTAFVSSDFLRNALGFGSDEYSAVQLQLYDPFQSVAVADRLAGLVALNGVKVSEWQADNKDLLVGLQSQSSSSYMIQTFVLIAVALGIASTLAISAVQKTRQVGILKALGMTDRRTAEIFVWQAALLGVSGTVLGVALGLLLITGFQFAGARFTVTPQPVFVAISAGVGILVAMLSAIIPARRTSRVDPIEVIQGA